MSLIKLAWLATAMLSLLVVFAQQREEPAESSDEAPALQKTDREQLVAYAVPQPILGENVAVLNPPIKMPPVVIVQEEEERPHKRRDVCTRHGMHKVITRGSRSWRCAK